MNNQIGISGRTNEEGDLFIHGEDYMNDFRRKNPNKTFLITFRAYEKKSSKAFIGYYRNKILPDVQRAFLEKGVMKSIENIDKELRFSCPATFDEIYDEKKRSYTKKLIDLENLEQFRLILFIDKFLYLHLIQAHNIVIDKTVLL